MSLSALETHLWEARDERERSLRQAERVVLALRMMLVEKDSTLPIYLDGTAWSEIERPYLERIAT